MHDTKVVLKDGTEHQAPLWEFRPQDGYLRLAGHEEPLWFSDIQSAVTAGDRQGDVDELDRARQFMRDARKYNWYGDLPVQDWE